MDFTLKTVLTGFLDGKKIPRPYRAVLMKREGIQPVIRIEEKLGDGHWNPTPGSWRVDALAGWVKDHAHQEIIYIDYGQHWAVAGMKEAVAEAYAIIMEGVPDGD